MTDARPLLSEIARLQAELAAAEEATRKAMESIPLAMDAAAAKEREACAARIRKLETALEPFASQELLALVVSRNMDGVSYFGDAACVSYPTTVGAIKSAVAAIRARTTEAGHE